MNPDDLGVKATHASIHIATAVGATGKAAFLARWFYQAARARGYH